jgi:hypothetical protein
LVSYIVASVICRLIEWLAISWRLSFCRLIDRLAISWRLSFVA